MKLLANFDADGRLVCLHTSPATNQCHSEKDRMLDQREIGMRELLSMKHHDDEGNFLADKLCDHCFGEDEG